MRLYCSDKQATILSALEAIAGRRAPNDGLFASGAKASLGALAPGGAFFFGGDKETASSRCALLDDAALTIDAVFEHGQNRKVILMTREILPDFPVEVHPPLVPLACPKCGTVALPTVQPGAGPHHARAACPHCGAFLRWLPKPRPHVHPQPQGDQA